MSPMDQWKMHVQTRFKIHIINPIGNKTTSRCYDFSLSLQWLYSGGNTTFIWDWNGSLNFLGFIFLVVAMFTMYTIIAHDKWSTSEEVEESVNWAFVYLHRHWCGGQMVTPIWAGLGKIPSLTLKLSILRQGKIIIKGSENVQGVPPASVSREFYSISSHFRELVSNDIK